MSNPSPVSPALMLRQLSFAMRVSRALYAGVELGIADILASGAQTSTQIAAGRRAFHGRRRTLGAMV